MMLEPETTDYVRLHFTFQSILAKIITYEDWRTTTIHQMKLAMLQPTLQPIIDKINLDLDIAGNVVICGGRILPPNEIRDKLMSNKKWIPKTTKSTADNKNKVGSPHKKQRAFRKQKNRSFYS